ncbi:UNVERIFIED_CONTAM: Ras- protein Rab-7L1 [Gekko kuhli]
MGHRSIIDGTADALVILVVFLPPSLTGTQSSLTASETVPEGIGQERFTSMTRLYYREASACIIMFDVTSISTFTSCQKWKQDLDSKLKLPDGSPVPCLLLANKCDLSPWAVTREEIDHFSKENAFTGWTETSVKENKNVNESMRVLIEKMMTMSLNDGESSVPGHGDYINLKDASTPNWGCC